MAGEAAVLDDAGMGSERGWRGAPGRLGGGRLRWLAGGLAVTAALGCVCAASSPRVARDTTLARPAAGSVRALLARAAQSMISHHIRGPRTGIGWRGRARSRRRK